MMRIYLYVLYFVLFLAVGSFSYTLFMREHLTPAEALGKVGEFDDRLKKLEKDFADQKEKTNAAAAQTTTSLSALHNDVKT